MVNQGQSNPEEAGVTTSASPVQAGGESQWILQSINSLDTRVGQNFMQLSEKIDHNAARQDARLRRAEESISSFKGWLKALGVGLVILQVLAFLAYRFLDISLRTPP